MKKHKPLPHFKTEAQEAEFWKTHDSSEYVDWENARPVTFPNLKPTTKTISLRLPAMLLEEIRSLANKRDVPYQSLMKILLANALRKEQESPA